MLFRSLCLCWYSQGGRTEGGQNFKFSEKMALAEQVLVEGVGIFDDINSLLFAIEEGYSNGDPQLEEDMLEALEGPDQAVQVAPEAMFHWAAITIIIRPRHPTDWFLSPKFRQI
mgnify:CR=1 FL=1